MILDQPPPPPHTHVYTGCIPGWSGPHHTKETEMTTHTTHTTITRFTEGAVR